LKWPKATVPTRGGLLVSQPKATVLERGGLLHIAAEGRKAAQPSGRQGVQAPAWVAQARQGESAGQGGLNGDAPRQRRDGGVAEAARDSNVLGSAVSSGGRWRWWPVPRALVTEGEVRSRGNLDGKTQGGGAHREAEVAAMVGPNRRSGAASSAREGPHELAMHAGRVRMLELGRRAWRGGHWGGGRRVCNAARWCGAKRKEKGRGSAWARPHGGGRRRGEGGLPLRSVTQGSQQRTPAIESGRRRCCVNRGERRGTGAA
jgi:hypothetical protein